jgi:hypothetical protein
MNSSSVPEISGTKIDQTIRPFHVVLLYSGDNILDKARSIVQRVTGEHLTDVDFHQDEFSFSEVMHPELSAETAQLAAECDLFVLATEDGGAVPQAISTWLKAWLNARPLKETALVSLAGSTVGNRCEVEELLQQLAKTNELTFFSSRMPMPARPSLPPGAAKSPAPRYAPQPERWGLNE